MYPSGDMIGGLVAILSIVFVVAKLIGNIGLIWENITTGKQILEFIGEILEWANYERNLRESLESLNRKKKLLECMESDLIEEVEGVEFRTNKQRKREVGNWLTNVRAKLNDAARTEEEVGWRNFATRFLFRAWFGKCVKAEEEEVDELIRRRDALGNRADLVREPDNGVIQHRLTTSVLVGKVSADKRESIRDKLFDPTVRTLGIVGEKGMGKTSMIANIHNKEVAESGLFTHVFYVAIRGDVDVLGLQAVIGAAMRLDDFTSTSDESRRAYRIQITLNKCGKFLLILDGLCQYIRFTEVGIPIEEGEGKLVVVSRYRDVCKRTCEKVIEMERLPDNDAKELFMRTLRPPAPLPGDIREIASEIIGQCGGVPAVIVEAAESLRGVDDIHTWRVNSRKFS